MSLLQSQVVHLIFISRADSFAMRSCLHMYRRQSRWAVIQMEEDDAGDGTADAAGSKEPPLFRPRKKNEVMPVSESAAAGHLGPVPTASAPGASRLESVPRI